MQKNYLRFVIVTLLLLLFSACDGGNNNSPTANNNNLVNVNVNKSNSSDFDVNKSNPSKSESEVSTVGDKNLTFNFKDAEAIFVHNKTFKLTDLNGIAGATTEAGNTISNILMVDKDKKSHLAIQSKNPIKVLYTVVDSDAKRIYVAFDVNYSNEANSAEDYTAFFKQYNCALFEVSTTDNNYKCVKEGLYLQAIDEAYYKNLDENQKPIQFDNNGSIYFLASTFDTTAFKVNTTTPLLYKYNPIDYSIKPISQDNDKIGYFTILASGEVLFKSTNTSSNTNGLYITQGNSKIDINTQSYDINFFTTDSYNTVIFSEVNNKGINLVQPLEIGGVKRTILDTTQFGGKPKRIIIADDGNIYGVFEENNYAENLDITIHEAVVYQILPYSPTAKARINLGNEDYYSFIKNLPLQISKGYIYYSEKSSILIDGVSYGTANTISMIRLSTQEKTVILDTPKTTTDARYELYNWRLSNGKLYFSGLEQKDNNVVTGLIDTFGISSGDILPKDAISITKAFSATKETLAINDITVIQPQKPENDTGNIPNITKSSIDSANPFSLSLEFSKYMNYESVMSHITLKDSDSAKSINFMPIWINKSLHLVPDVDNSLGDETTLPLERGHTYKLLLDNSDHKLVDAWDGELATKEYSVTIDNIYTNIFMIGDKNTTIGQYSNYIDVGAIASDDADGDLSSKVVCGSGEYYYNETDNSFYFWNTLDTQQTGSYTYTCAVRNSKGYISTDTRVVNVVKGPYVEGYDYHTKLPQEIIPIGTIFTPTPVVFKDDNDANVSNQTATISGDIVDTSVAGTYIIIYSMTNNQGITTTKTREVIVGSIPTISFLDGKDINYISNMSDFTSVTSTQAYDSIDGDLTSSIECGLGTISLSSDNNIIFQNSYTGLENNFIYSCGIINSTGHISKVSKTIILADAPIINNNNDLERQFVALESIFVAQPITITDATDANISDKLIITGEVNTSTAGTYIITYSVTNSKGATTTKTREVIVDELTTISFADSADKKISTYSYHFENATASDNQDGNLTQSIVCGLMTIEEMKSSYDYFSGTSTDTLTPPIDGITPIDKIYNPKTMGNMVDTSQADGTYTYTCAVKNSRGYIAHVSKNITIEYVSLNDSDAYLDEQIVNLGEEFIPNEVIFDDITDDNISQREITIVGAEDVNTSKAGIYTITYSVTNSNGVTSIKAREIKVVSIPQISFVDDSNLTLARYSNIFIEEIDATGTINRIYSDIFAKAVASDSLDGNLTSNIVCGEGVPYQDSFDRKIKFNGYIHTNTLGTSMFTCAVVNSFGYISSVSKGIIIKEGTAINDRYNVSNYSESLQKQFVDIGSVFAPIDVIVNDSSDAFIGYRDIVIGGDEVNTSVAGNYNISYSITNSLGVTAINTREIEVAKLPSISFIDSSDMTIARYSDYSSQAIAYDENDGNLTSSILCGNQYRYNYYYNGLYIDYSVSTSTSSTGTYTYTCTVKNSEGVINAVSKQITIENGAYVEGYQNTPLPKQIIDIGSEFVPEDITFVNYYDNNSSDYMPKSDISIIGDVNTSTIGTYNISYIITDNNGVTAIKKQQIEVNRLPDITLVGSNTISVNIGEYIEYGATATDNVDGNLTNKVSCGVGSFAYDTYTNTIYFDNQTAYTNLDSTIGQITVTCAVGNSAGMVSSVDRVVNINDGSCFEDNNLIYCEVATADGRVWLDRNLGASRVCQSSTDSNCYGDYYQWSRATDGHQLSTSLTTDINPTTFPYISTAFEMSSIGNFDWLSTSEFISERKVSWSSPTDNSVCPTGFYVPTKSEVDILTNAEGIYDGNTAFNSALHLPLAGARNITSSMEYVGVEGYIWTTDTSDTTNTSYAFIYNNIETVWSRAYRAMGYSVRCIKAQ